MGIYAIHYTYPDDTTELMKVRGGETTDRDIEDQKLRESSNS